MRVSGDDWARALKRGGEVAGEFLALMSRQNLKPGESVLGLMMAAYGLTQSTKQLPSFEWYAAKVMEVLGDLREQVNAGS